MEHSGMLSKVTRMGVLEDMKESREAEMLLDRPCGKLVMWRHRMWLAVGRTMHG